MSGSKAMSHSKLVAEYDGTTAQGIDVKGPLWLRQRNASIHRTRVTLRCSLTDEALFKPAFFCVELESI